MKGSEATRRRHEDRVGLELSWVLERVKEKAVCKTGKSFEDRDG